MKVMISINREATGKIPAGDPRWGTFNDNFIARDLELVEIANEIFTGHAYAGIFQGRRRKENFVAAQHIGVDMDSGDERSSFNTLLQHDLVKMYAGLIHTTPSHTDKSPRTRILFFLDTPFTSTHDYEVAARFLSNQFDGADTSCTDASRFFYGAKDCNIWFSDNVLPISHINMYRQDWERANAPKSNEPNTEKDDSEKEVSIDDLIDPVKLAREGNRNNVLNKQAFWAGRHIKSGKINELEITPRLLEAALQIGLGERESAKTIQSGIRGGLRS